MVEILGAISQQATGSFSPSSTELRAFAGDYSNADLDVTYIVAERDAG